MSTMLRSLAASAVIASSLAYSMAATAAPVVTNGDFSAGFTGWTTTFTSANGTLGVAPLPRVDAFGTNNNPLSAPFAAEFNAGQLTTPTAFYEGGSLSQLIALPGGDIHFSADIGAFNPAGQTNSFGGKFEVLLNGVVKVSFEFPPLASLASNTHVLAFDDFVAGGAYTLEIRVTTPNLSINSSVDADLPASARQFLTNVAVTVPEPTTVALLLAALGGLLILRSRRNAAA